MAGVVRPTGAATSDGARARRPAARAAAPAQPRPASSARPRGDHDRERTRLADRVLAAPAAGRGKADLPLVGLAHRGFGAAAGRPGDDQRRTSCSGWRACCSPTTWSPSAPTRSATSWARPWRRRFRLVGDPLVAAATREHLLARGRPEGGPRPFVVAVGRPLDELLAHTWTQRCFETGATPWAEWLRFWRERDQLPARADLVGVRTPLGRAPALRPGRHRPRPAAPPGRRTAACPPVRVPGADQAELARRIAAVVGLRVAGHERPALMRTLQQRIPDSGVAPVGVPAARARVGRARPRPARSAA